MRFPLVKVQQHRGHCPAPNEAAIGRLNLIGALDFTSKKLCCRDLQGRCDGGKCADFLERLAEQATPEVLTVVLDNARFHKAKPIKEEAVWQAKGLYLRYLPPYSPQLNPIEGCWRVLKGFLMPRRCYPSLAALKQAVFSALDLLNAINV